MGARKVTIRKYLIRDLARNIEFEKEEELEFNGYVFSFEGENTYYVSSPDSDIGSVDLSEITEQWLKMRCNKSQKKEPKPMKKSRLVSKPRKVKKYDIILKVFMVHLHTQQCIVDGCCNNNIEAHHIYGRQPMRHDILCVPLCSYHHTGSVFSVHEGEVKAFRNQYSKKIMEEKSIEILSEWVNNEGSYLLSDEEIRLFAELIPYLQKSEEYAYDKKIKEFLIEYGRRDN